MDDFYREELLDHAFSSTHRGKLDAPDLAAEGRNPLCGDIVRVEAALDDSGCVDCVRFDGKGCAISQAAASLLSEHLEGKSLEDVRAFGAQEMLGLLGIPLTPARQKCALLAWRTLGRALTEASTDDATSPGA